jgi:predicted NAD/FAD-binding protein
MKIAVIGAGISGLGAAWLLQRHHDVTLYEADRRLGGHAHTVDIALPSLSGHPQNLSVDTGFIVYNEKNYPHLTRLFEALDVRTSPSDMSFSVSLGDGKLEYAGSGRGLLAQPSNLLKPGYWHMMHDITRFYREAPALLDAGPQANDIALGDYLRREGYSHRFIYDHLLPMGAAIWSSTLNDMMDFPLISFVRFFNNHGLLSYSNRPGWRTVTNGSRSYVDKLIADFHGRVLSDRSVSGIKRSGSGVVVTDKTGAVETYDQVVLACHADQALAMLRDAAAEEHEALRSFRYQRNQAVLHLDQSLMPRRRQCWASWNYLAERSRQLGRRVSVTYWMNSLQPLQTDVPVLLSLNPLSKPRRGTVLGEFSYDHPQFDLHALRAQEQLGAIQGVRRTWFCGSYCGYGFHEDGLEAGFAVARALGAAAPWDRDVISVSPAAIHAAPREAAEAAE